MTFAYSYAFVMIPGEIVATKTWVHCLMLPRSLECRRPIFFSFFFCRDKNPYLHTERVFLDVVYIIAAHEINVG